MTQILKIMSRRRQKKAKKGPEMDPKPEFDGEIGVAGRKSFRIRIRSFAKSKQ